MRIRQVVIRFSLVVVLTVYVLSKGKFSFIWMASCITPHTSQFLVHLNNNSSDHDLYKSACGVDMLQTYQFERFVFFLIKRTKRRLTFCLEWLYIERERVEHLGILLFTLLLFILFQRRMESHVREVVQLFFLFLSFPLPCVKIKLDFLLKRI